MKGLTKLQIKFLDAYAHGEQGVQAILSDQKLTYRHLQRWQWEPVFQAELLAVQRWLAFQREADTRISAAAAMRRLRQMIQGQGAFKERERPQVRDVIDQARRVDQGFEQSLRRQRHHPLARPVESAIHPRFAAEAERIVERMEALREAAQPKASPRPKSK